MHKKPGSDLKKHYTIFLEAGLILVLLLFIVAMRVEWRDTGENIDLTQEQEVVEMEEVIQTEQEKKPPPQRPRVPVEVPNDEIIEDQEINLDADMELDERLDTPPPLEEGEGEEEEGEDYFEAVGHMPEPIGGVEGIHDRINYPERARRAGIEGTVHVRFFVNKNGEVEDPKVVRGLEGGCNEEALRVIRETKFKPGMQRGRPVKVLMGQTVHFRLRN